jgi:hypothetical protein
VGQCAARGSTQFHHDLRNRFPDAAIFVNCAQKNFAPVNCITLAGYGLRYFPSAELLCRVALQAFRRVDQRGRRCPFPAGQRRIERVLISARGLL